MKHAPTLQNLRGNGATWHASIKPWQIPRHNQTDPLPAGGGNRTSLAACADSHSRECGYLAASPDKSPPLVVRSRGTAMTGDFAISIPPGRGERGGYSASAS